MSENDQKTVGASTDDVTEKAADDTTLKRNFVFHVVNSVKGGCGKSAYALYLADYWAQQNEPVYLIDLDTDGTSWMDDYKDCYREKREDVPFLNDIIDNDEIHHKIDIWRHFSDSSGAVKNFITVINAPVAVKNFKTVINDPEDKKNFRTVINDPENKKNFRTVINDPDRTALLEVNLCLSDPEKRKTTWEYQIDLFEQAVRGLVEDEILTKANRKPGNRIHVIFDMPPGNDLKAERIFKHWLLNQSILHGDNALKNVTADYDLGETLEETEKNKNKKIEELKGSYEVRLHMLSTLAASSINANLSYISALLSQPSGYGDILSELIKNDAFSVQIVLNDATRFTGDDYLSISDSKTIMEKQLVQHLPLICRIRTQPRIVGSFVPFIENAPSRVLQTADISKTCKPFVGIKQISTCAQCEVEYDISGDKWECKNTTPVGLDKVLSMEH